MQYIYFITYISYICHENIIVSAHKYYKHNLRLIYYCYINIQFKNCDRLYAFH